MPASGEVQLHPAPPKIPPALLTNLTATSLDTRPEVLAKYGDAAARSLAQLAAAGVGVAHVVDATLLATAVLPVTGPFDRIVFNFPSCGQERVPGLNRNRCLLSAFLASAVRKLSLRGEVHVTLCKHQEDNDQWQLSLCAAKAGLTLFTSTLFDRAEFPGYVPRRGNGNFGAFPTGGARSHVLRAAASAPV